jgi:Protein of unknown function (DUF4254)
MILIQDIVPLQDGLTRAWHDQPDGDFSQTRPLREGEVETDEKAREDWLRLVARQHHANFELWHIEDEARTPGASDADLAAVKRRIDQTNQQRNDLVEQLDRMLLEWLEPQGLPKPEAPLHSETPGLIIDRLSILSLKIYHTRRVTVSATGNGWPFWKSSGATSPDALASYGTRFWAAAGDLNCTGR